jgi:hypothetical protein
MTIDWKYKINAVNPCSKNTHTEEDSILFLAKDKAVPAMLRTYLAECEQLGANPAHLEAIQLLVGRVDAHQQDIESKVPDTDLPCEIRRCVEGEGVRDIRAAGGAPAEQDEMWEAAYGLSPWLSAALDDPKVCQQYKDAINAWFNTGMPCPVTYEYLDRVRDHLTASLGTVEELVFDLRPIAAAEEDERHASFGAVKSAKVTEYGWLVENGKNAGEGLAYRFINNDNGGIWDWTEDHNKALRFARREDAEQFAHHDEDAWRVVQHGWD